MLTRELLFEIKLNRLPVLVLTLLYQNTFLTCHPLLLLPQSLDFVFNCYVLTWTRLLFFTLTHTKSIIF